MHITLEEVDSRHGQPPGTAWLSFLNRLLVLEQGRDYTREGDTVYLTERGYILVIMPFDDELSWQIWEAVVDAVCTAASS
jgi:hypothetical protein